MRKRLLIIVGAIALYGFAHLCQTLDVGAANAATTHTAGIRGVAVTELVA